MPENFLPQPDDKRHRIDRLYYERKRGRSVETRSKEAEKATVIFRPHQNRLPSFKVRRTAGDRGGGTAPSRLSQLLIFSGNRSVVNEFIETV